METKGRYKGKSSKRLPGLHKSLHRLPTKFVKDCGFIPVVLINTTAVIEKYIKTKEIFQTQGTPNKAFATLNLLSTGRINGRAGRNLTVHDAVEAMKLVLVSLPEPLIPEDVCDALITASRDNSAHQYGKILSKFRMKSPLNFGILHYMMILLRKVSLHTEYNQMDVRKLATIFVLDVIKPLKLDDPNDGDFLSERMQRLPYLIMVVEKLILNVGIFQNARSKKVDVPPLPGMTGVYHGQISTLSKAAGSGDCAGLLTLEDEGETNLDSAYNEALLEHCLQGRSVSADSVRTAKMDGAINVFHLHADDSHVGVPSTALMSDRSSPVTLRCASSNSTQQNYNDPDLHTHAPYACGPSQSMDGTITNTANPDKISCKTMEDKTLTKPVSRRVPPIWRKNRTKPDSVPKIGQGNDQAEPQKRGKSIACTTGIEKKTMQKKKKTPYMNSTTERNKDNSSFGVKHPGEKRRAFGGKSIKPGSGRRKRKTGTNKSKKSNEKLANTGSVDRMVSFRQGELMSPWPDEGGLSDDTSLMKRTIRNPRVLAVSPMAFHSSPELSSRLKIKNKNKSPLPNMFKKSTPIPTLQSPPSSGSHFRVIDPNSPPNRNLESTGDSLLASAISDSPLGIETLAEDNPIKENTPDRPQVVGNLEVLISPTKSNSGLKSETDRKDIKIRSRYDPSPMASGRTKCDPSPIDSGKSMCDPSPIASKMTAQQTAHACCGTSNTKVKKCPREGDNKSSVGSDWISTTITNATSETSRSSSSLESSSITSDDRSLLPVPQHDPIGTDNDNCQTQQVESTEVEQTKQKEQLHTLKEDENSQVSSHLSGSRGPPINDVLSSTNSIKSSCLDSTNQPSYKHPNQTKIIHSNLGGDSESSGSYLKSRQQLATRRPLSDQQLKRLTRQEIHQRLLQTKQHQYQQHQKSSTSDSRKPFYTQNLTKRMAIYTVVLFISFTTIGLYREYA